MKNKIILRIFTATLLIATISPLTILITSSFAHRSDSALRSIANDGEDSIEFNIDQKGRKPLPIKISRNGSVSISSTLDPGILNSIKPRKLDGAQIQKIITAASLEPEVVKKLQAFGIEVVQVPGPADASIIPTITILSGENIYAYFHYSHQLMKFSVSDYLPDFSIQTHDLTGAYVTAVDSQDLHFSVKVISFEYVNKNTTQKQGLTMMINDMVAVKVAKIFARPLIQTAAFDIDLYLNGRVNEVDRYTTHALVLNVYHGQDKIDSFVKPVSKEILSLYEPKDSINIHDGLNEMRSQPTQVEEPSQSSQDVRVKEASQISQAVRATKPSQSGYSQYLTTFGKEMNKSVFGQPEAIGILTDIETQNILNNGQRKLPEVFMFAGTPASGKDSLVEAYVRTRFSVFHNQPNVDIDAHIFRFPVIKEEKDAWAITGSAPGYKGSENVSALNRFLVLHSGGKYQIEKVGLDETINLNTYWKPGQVLDGYFAPEDAVIFANEWHDWSLDMKNKVLKEPLEKGYFVVGNPGSGINRLQVPVTIALASNNGMGLIISMDKDGKRIGEPLSEAQLQERWALNAPNKAKLKEDIASSSQSNPQGGTSKEILSRIPDSRLVLLRVLKKEDVIKVVKLKLLSVSEKFSKPKPHGFPSLKITFKGKLIEWLTKYDQLPEEGGRPIDNKIKTLIEGPLVAGLVSEKLKLKNNEEVSLDVIQNKDGTYSLKANNQKILISYTEKERDRQSITNAEIDDLIDLESKLNARLKGLSHITKLIAKGVRISANREKEKHVDFAKKTADVYMFLGTSSTGKTETGVALHQILYKTESKPLVIDFGQIKTDEDIKSKILGARDRDNKAILSDFMKAYDAANGKLVILLDEFTNGVPSAQQAIYDILREPVVRTFSDGVARPMGDVKIIISGNYGEEWYKNIPRDMPESEQLEAARRIYDNATSNPGYLRQFLQGKFTEAFLNRIGSDRIFFFAPHTNKTTRELIQMKLISAFKELVKPAPGKRTWNIKFQSAQDYEQTILAIEDYGFKIWEQGASIKNFIDVVLLPEIHDKLLTSKIADNAVVVLVKSANNPTKDGTLVGFQLLVAGQKKPIELEVIGKPTSRKVRQADTKILLTAFHEAGHEVVNHVLMGDKLKPGGISTLPGVTLINGEAVLYEGIAQQIPVESYDMTREIVINQIAIYAAGEAGELLTTKNARHTAGKSDDMLRATNLASMAVLKWGLSEKWGRLAMPDKVNLDQYLAGLSSAKKRVYETELQSFIQAGRELARAVIISNYELLFNPIGQVLAASGETSGPALEKFYRQREKFIIHPDNKAAVKKSVEAFEARIKGETSSEISRDIEFYSFVAKPKKVVDVDALRARNKSKELAEVDLAPGLLLVRKESFTAKLTNTAGQLNNSKSEPAGRALMCRKLFL